MITIFSAEDCRYQRWQANLLRYSFRKAGMMGTLAPIYHPGGEPYAGLCKVKDICDWAALDQDSQETVLCVDPDFVFVKPIRFSLSPGTAVGQRIGYMSTSGKEELVAKYCSRPDMVAPVGVPIAMCRCDWFKLRRPWVEKTVAIRADNYWGKELGWICEMWAYCFAAAELGLKHNLVQICAFPGTGLKGESMIHYCYNPPSYGGYTWSKRTYQPWESIPIPILRTYPAAGRALLELVEEYSEIRRNQSLPISISPGAIKK